MTFEVLVEDLFLNTCTDKSLVPIENKSILSSGLEFLKHERSVKYLASAQPIPSGTQFKPAQTV